MFTFSDYLAIAWIACDEESYPIVTSVMLEEHIIEYYSELMNTHYKNSETGVEEKQPGYRVLEIDMRLDDDVKMPGNGEVYDEFYAKRMRGKILLKTAANSYNLNNIIVRVGYSHTVFTIGVEPSISVDDSVGLGFSFSYDWKGQNLYDVEKNYKYDGTRVY